MFPLALLRTEAREFVRARQRKDPRHYSKAEEVMRHIRLMEPSGEIVTGPYHVAVIEQLRAEVADELKTVPSLATDLFVIGSGEPRDPRCTKVGGHPFWPRPLDWPQMPDGRPRRFIAQFCFADSRSLVGALPGEILSIFGSPESLDPDQLECHWLAGNECDLLPPQDVPATNGLRPCYGVLHRTVDFKGNPPVLERFERPWLLAQLEGTKIGGLPRWIQYPVDLPGRFLCSLGSIHPKVGRLHPYVNAVDALQIGNTSGERNLMWGDVGTVYLFVDDTGSVKWTMQCY